MSPALLNRLRQVLLASGLFVNYAQLVSIFVDDRLSLWQHEVPDAGNPADRVDVLIPFLWRKTNADVGNDNGLVLFLTVLQEIRPEGDGLRPQLLDLATELRAEAELKDNLATVTFNNPEAREIMRKLLQRFQNYHRELQEWKGLQDHLDGLLIAAGPFATQIEETYCDGEHINARRLERLRSKWQAIEEEIEDLQQFGRQVQQIGKPFTEIQTGGEIGVEWADEIEQKRRAIAEHLQQNAFLENWLFYLYNLSGELDNAIKTHLTRANEQLSMTATQLYQLSADLLEGQINE